jgi:sulfur carrier protein
VRLTINGVATEVPDGTTVAGLVRDRLDDRRRVAVALNGAVVPRGAWEQTRLAGGDTVEVLAPTAGG